MRKAQGFPRAPPYDPHCPPHHITAATSQGGMPLVNQQELLLTQVEWLKRMHYTWSNYSQVINILTVIRLDCCYS